MKELLRRSLRTFVQTAGAYIATNLVCATSGITDLGVLKTVLIGLAVSSVAAGLAAVMNLPPKASGGEKDDDASLSDDESGDDGKDDGEDES